ncbi:LYR motif-containing protein [Sphingobacterium hotanense]|uniref:hypothetical protein n=1 Tax=Sphingobacterium hotanense TaxID=649196 RepID=UPI0011F2EAB5|nr:hypothetical protein [Sphingobacterium hotanense]
MNLYSIVDLPIDEYITNEIFPGSVAPSLNGTYAEGEKHLLKHIIKQTNQFKDPLLRQYALRKLHDAFIKLDFTDEQKLNGEQFTEYRLKVFNAAFQTVVNGLVLELHDAGVNVYEETFSQNDYDALKSKVDDIAENLYDFITKQNDMNNFNFNNYEELRDFVMQDVDKVALFGKDTVKHFIFGKISDMAFKAGAMTLLSSVPTEYESLASSIKQIL